MRSTAKRKLLNSFHNGVVSALRRDIPLVRLKPDTTVRQENALLRWFDERLSNPSERRSPVTCRELEEAKEHLCGEKRITPGRMPVVRNHTEHVAECVERERTDWRAPGERAVAFEVQGQIHRVEASILGVKTPSALVARIERPDVVPDVVSDDHAVPHIVEKPDQGLLFLRILREPRRV